MFFLKLERKEEQKTLLTNYHHPWTYGYHLFFLSNRLEKNVPLGPLPSLLLPSTEAPDFSSSSTASEWPLPAAKAKGVPPRKPRAALRALARSIFLEPVFLDRGYFFDFVNLKTVRVSLS